MCQKLVHFPKNWHEMCQNQVNNSQWLKRSISVYFGSKSMEIGPKKYTSQKEVPSSTPASPTRLRSVLRPTTFRVSSISPHWISSSSSRRLRSLRLSLASRRSTNTKCSTQSDKAFTRPRRIQNAATVSVVGPEEVLT